MDAQVDEVTETETDELAMETPPPAPSPAAADETDLPPDEARDQAPDEAPDGASDEALIRDNYSRAEDLRLKTLEVEALEQEVRAQRRAVGDGELADAVALRDRFAEDLAAAAAMLPILARENPQAAAAQRTALAGHRALLDGLNEEIALIERQGRAERRAAIRARLVERAPELKSDGAFARFERDAMRYLARLGFSEAEIADGLDHRDFMVVRDALAWRRLQSGRRGLAERSGRPAAPRPLPPTAGQRGGRPSDAALERMRQKALQGSTQDKVAYIAARIADR